MTSFDLSNDMLVKRRKVTSWIIIVMDNFDRKHLKHATCATLRLFDRVVTNEVPTDLLQSVAVGVMYIACKATNIDVNIDTLLYYSGGGCSIDSLLDVAPLMRILHEEDLSVTTLPTYYITDLMHLTRLEGPLQPVVRWIVHLMSNSRYLSLETTPRMTAAIALLAYNNYLSPRSFKLLAPVLLKDFSCVIKTRRHKRLERRAQ